MGRIRFPRRREQTSSPLLKINYHRQSAQSQIWIKSHQQHIITKIRRGAVGGPSQPLFPVDRPPPRSWPWQDVATADIIDTKGQKGTAAGSIPLDVMGYSRHAQGESRLTYFGDRKIAPLARGYAHTHNKPFVYPS